MIRAYLNWSSGKDAMLALHLLQDEKKIGIEKLVTTVNTDLNRVSMHGLPIKLLQQQADSLQIPLHQIPLRGNVSLKSYNEVMLNHCKKLQEQGFTHSVFGDIFLEDLKEYRQQQLEKLQLTPVFPLWKKDTKKLISKFIELGYKAIVVCVNAKLLDKSFCGRIIDHSFLNDLPENIDWCGENGEFHTFVFDGPLFKKPLSFRVGEKVLKDYNPSEGDDCFKDEKEQNWDNKFWYQDLRPQ
ncbi:Dph6-related ATP pyrophosphatase [Mesonia maritima]|uniref:Uncharacterized protein (TIGR00290 family) n=1 Tax=Mesonia maritima TaxID=1793873 RepID=A0ABU1K448_9FLAO|nr:ATP-binding protein [Mesonia maritima]MDR6300397.1 uncharacterized protein (TIGR00290 family) [Mesonia maritima]